MTNPIVNWSNYSNSTANTGTSITVGSTNANGSNGPFANGDFIVAVVSVFTNGGGDPGSASTSMTSAGFAAITNGDQYNSGGTYDWRTYVGWKLAGPSESGAYAASWSGTAVGVAWALLDISPVPGSPIDASGGLVTTALQASAPAPGLTLSGDSDLLINIYTCGIGNNGAFTLPNTTVLQTPGRSFNTPLIGVSSLLPAVGTGQNASYGGNSNPSSGFSIAIMPLTASLATGLIGLASSEWHHKSMVGWERDLRSRVFKPNRPRRVLMPWE